jgi:DNA-directed RNA polymerase beta subunit
MPESFSVLINELRGLCVDIKFKRKADEPGL